jgi:Ca-activated chloride channel family protein
VWKDAHGLPLDGVESYPARLPDLFRDRPVRVFAKLPAGFRGEVTVRANGLGHRFEETVPLDAQHPTDSTALEKLFGRARVDDLMVQWMTARDDAARERVRRDVVATALEHQLITQFTSRVAVEERVSRNPADKLRSGKVPLPLPRGWDPSQFVATATSDAARLLAALGLVLLAALCRWIPKARA